MASRKKKAPAAEAAVSLKQKSLLFFFSKPSTRPPLQEAQRQNTIPRVGDDDDDSHSSSLQDAGDSLRWSQLLTGWSPTLEIETTLKESGVDGGIPVHNKVGKTEGDVIGKMTPTLLSASLVGNADSTNVNMDAAGNSHDSTDKSDGREARVPLIVCKRCRSSMDSQHPSCLPSHDDGENTAELVEASAECCQTVEARKKCRMDHSVHDERFATDCNGNEPDLQPMLLDCEPLCPGSVSRKSGKINCRETRSDAACPVLSRLATPDLQNTSAHPSAIEEVSALKFDADNKNYGISEKVCGLMEEKILHSVQVDISNGDEKSIDAGKGCNKPEAAATLDIEDRHGFCELDPHSDLVDSDMLDEGKKTVSLVALNTNAKSSFLKLQRGYGHRVSAPDELLQVPLTDYEREREENILRNQHFMQKLGLTSSALTTNKELHSRSCPKPKTKPITKVKLPPVPIRRSRRLNSPTSVGCHLEDDREAADDAAVDEESLFYDDSSVLKYTCGEAFSISAPYPCEECTKHGGNNVLGFQPLDQILQDKYLTRIYAMSACFVSQSQRTLLAAGGHQGHIAVFGTTCYDANSINSGPLVSLDADSNESQEPLLSWKGSSCWISGVKFLSVQAQENANLLLSSANDGNLVLWDINKQQKVHQSSKSLAGLSPLKVAEAIGIHSNGIFSMHEYCGQVATASKDATVGYTRITNQDIIAERSIFGHHAGAIRSVNFRDASIIADCGSDGFICILDLRMAEPCTLRIDTADAMGVNVVEWCPSKEHVLLSASKDPQISLHDVRNTKKPLHKLSGHVNAKVQRCSQIYRPTFVAQGGAIATPGQGSKGLSLYSVDTGKAISRGHLGYDATMVMWAESCDKSTSVLWVASRHIAQLLPLWQTQE